MRIDGAVLDDEVQIAPDDACDGIRRGSGVSELDERRGDAMRRSDPPHHDANRQASSQELGKECSNHSVDTVSIEELVQRFHASVYRYAYWLSGCSATAEDIAQETFVRAMRGLERLRDPKAAESWLLTITRNEFFRWKGNQRVQLANDLLDIELDAGKGVARIDDIEWVHAGLAELPEEFRVVLLMFYFENLSYTEIAKQLQIPLGTVMSRLSRGRNHLKNALVASANPNPMTPGLLNGSGEQGGSQ